MSEYSQKSIREAIDALRILADTGDEQAQEAIDALQLLLTDEDMRVSAPQRLPAPMIRFIPSYIMKSDDARYLKRYESEAKSIAIFVLANDAVEKHIKEQEPKWLIDEWSKLTPQEKSNYNEYYRRLKNDYANVKVYEFLRELYRKSPEAQKKYTRIRSYIQSEFQNTRNYPAKYFHDLISTVIRVAPKTKHLFKAYRPTIIRTDTGRRVKTIIEDKKEFNTYQDAFNYLVTEYPTHRLSNITELKEKPENRKGIAGAKASKSKVKIEFFGYGYIVTKLTKKEQELVDVRFRTSVANLEKILDENTIVDEVSDIKYRLEDLIQVKKDKEEKPEIEAMLDEFYESVATYLKEQGKLIDDSDDDYGKGGTTFQDKVNAISGRLEGTQVPRRLRSDYGRRYNKEEAKKAAQRIAGAMRKKGY